MIKSLILQAIASSGSPLAWIKLGVGLLLEAIRFLQTKQLLDAGEARAIAEGLDRSQEECDAAIKAREDFAHARERGDIGPDDDDGYRRD